MEQTMIIKCKMCGGDIQFTPGDTYGTCEYCGSTSTIPRGDDEQKLNRYNRANHFRRQCEFDKAVAAYEKILETDDTDAEAHWGALLSRYGIEYVEDPVTKRRVPTCHRVQVSSILADDDYGAALQYAPDEESRRLYEEQATEIAQIQKGILAISANEKPYDVFICYKETGENNQRTRDSALAQDIYYQLTEQGYKVFFSRITLEDKLGQQYEPYIFAALNSAKVMLVIGTKAEYFNAVWVKNEWSRYLMLMKNDRKRILIPCYRDMDPYDLPEELSTLQSQDMGKIGFIQDLLRGIQKVLGGDKKEEAPKIIERVVERGGDSGAAPGIESLMKRAYLFMEDRDFESADEYLDRVMDIDPEYAPAYAAKTCIALQFWSESQLGTATFLYDTNSDWIKALRFAKGKQREIYEAYKKETSERVQKQIRDYTYDCAVEIALNANLNSKLLDEVQRYILSCRETDPRKRSDGKRRPNYEENEAAFLKAVTSNEPGDIPEEAYETAAKLFEVNVKPEEGKNDPESAERAKQCRVLGEQARQKKIYREAEQSCQRAEGRKDAVALLAAAETFQLIPEYKDALLRAKGCQEEAAAIQKQEYQQAVESMKSAGTESEKWWRVRNLLNSDNLSGYRDVEQLRRQAEEQLKKAQDAENRIREQRDRAERQKKKKQLTIASAAAVLAVICLVVYVKVISPPLKYGKAEKLLAAGEYDAASEAFAALGEYKDAAYWVLESCYVGGRAYLEENRYAEAAELFSQIIGYRDVNTLITTNKELFDKQFSVGNVVPFGSYEQDNDASNGTEEIQWIVLAREGDEVLLISKYGLDAKPYHSKYVDMTWEQCDLRKWLNNDFINTAFTSEEQEAIQTTKVENSQNQGYSDYDTNGGNNTADYVFLLSYKEAFEDYFADDASRICQPTAYAKNQGAWTDDAGNCYWWLRSPSDHQDRAACVYSDGSRSYSSVDYDYSCVRPALWINLDSDIF